MALTLDEVRTALAPDEPDYAAIAARLGPPSVPFLSDLAAGPDADLAARAVSLAPYLSVADAGSVLAAGSGHPAPTVRVAVAAAVGAGALAPDAAEQSLSALLDDPDPGVRAWTLRSLQRVGLGRLRDRVAVLAGDDPVPAVRARAERVLTES